MVSNEAISGTPPNDARNVSHCRGHLCLIVDANNHPPVFPPVIDDANNHPPVFHACFLPHFAFALTISWCFQVPTNKFSVSTTSTFLSFHHYGRLRAGHYGHVEVSEAEYRPVRFGRPTRHKISFYEEGPPPIRVPEVQGFMQEDRTGFMARSPDNPLLHIMWLRFDLGKGVHILGDAFPAA